MSLVRVVSHHSKCFEIKKKEECFELLQITPPWGKRSPTPYSFNIIRNIPRLLT
jgi:hypothetical protein